MNVEIIRGQDTSKLFADRNWHDLHECCSWANLMQSAPFVKSWYESYQNQYEPLIAAGYSHENRLIALLPLAIDKNNSRLVLAGVTVCEYGTWLARTPEIADEFIISALNQLEKLFPHSVLDFPYLTKGTPLGWFENNKYWRSKCILKAENQPLLKFDNESEIESLLEKESVSKDLNEANKQKKTSLEKISDENCFSQVFDKAISFANLFLNSAYRPSIDKPSELKAFYLKLFRANLLYATLLKIDEKIASIHFDYKNHAAFLFGLTTISPFIVDNDLEKVHTLFICLGLLKQRIKTYGHSFKPLSKNQFSNSDEQIYALTFYFDKSLRLKKLLKNETVDKVRKISNSLKIETDSLQTTKYELRHKLNFFNSKSIVRKLAKRLRRENLPAGEMRVYQFRREMLKDLPNPNLMNRDNIEDVLKYEPTDSWHLSPVEFYRSVIERLSKGNHIYTKVIDGKLAHYGWLIEREEKSFFFEVNQTYILPPDSAAMFDFFTHPVARGKGLYQSALPQILHEAFQIPETKQVFISVMADNSSSRHCIEKVGFEYVRSFYGAPNKK
jgi:RimJ/RimL family protein N-acetyltransferase